MKFTAYGVRDICQLNDILKPEHEKQGYIKHSDLICDKCKKFKHNLDNNIYSIENTNKGVCENCFIKLKHKKGAKVFPYGD